MKKRYLLVGLALVLVVMQFIASGLPPVTKDNPGDIMATGLVSQEVAPLLKTSCYNCHSNETEYPWYSYVAPSSWLIASDVSKAREELNFSSWTDYDTTRMVSKLDDIATEVGEGKMPLGIYTVVHRSAKLSDEQRNLIIAWSESKMDELVGEEEDEEEDDDAGNQ